MIEAPDARQLLERQQDEICAALAHDFGRRPATLTRFVDILPAISSLKHARAHVSRWMRPRRRRNGRRAERVLKWLIRP
jgi:coniferyl-aldehyde dehydrogenase